MHIQAGVSYPSEHDYNVCYLLNVKKPISNSNLFMLQLWKIVLPSGLVPFLNKSLKNKHQQHMLVSILACF